MVRTVPKAQLTSCNMVADELQAGKVDAVHMDGSLLRLAMLLKMQT